METKVIDVSGWRWENWSGDGAPPVILNPAAGLHNFLAWCWGEVKEANQLAILCQRSDDVNMAEMIDSIQGRLMTVERVLEELCIRTAWPGKGAA